MSTVLVATEAGCRVFAPGGELETEMAGRDVTALALGHEGVCLAVIEGHEIWCRRPEGAWSLVCSARVPLQSITTDGAALFGSGDDATMVRLSSQGLEERLTGFDAVAGRDSWFSHGPPLSIRSLTTTADGAAILAAVHVGGAPRSEDGGRTWSPTLPIGYDVHEVRAHRSLPAVVAAATAVGLCVSRDGGLSWRALNAGLETTNSLAVAVLDDEIIFSVQDGPFPEHSQVWRCPLTGDGLEIVGSGLPAWLDGKVDTAHIAAGDGRAAIADGGGNLWLSQAGSRGWERLAAGIPNSPGILVV